MNLLPIGTPIRFLDLIIGYSDVCWDKSMTLLAGKGEHGCIAGYTRSHRCVYLVENAYEDIFPANSDDFEVISE